MWAKAAGNVLPLSESSTWGLVGSRFEAACTAAWVWRVALVGRAKPKARALVGRGGEGEQAATLTVTHALDGIDGQAVKGQGAHAFGLAFLREAAQGLGRPKLPVLSGCHHPGTGSFATGTGCAWRHRGHRS